MEKVFVTKKGAEMKTNPWKEGQEIDVHENLAEHFIKHGIASKDLAIEEDKQTQKQNKKDK